MSMFAILDALDGNTQRLFTPCHTCGHAHHCSLEQCKECECKECNCDNCKAKKEAIQNANKRFI